MECTPTESKRVVNVRTLSSSGDMRVRTGGNLLGVGGRGVLTRPGLVDSKRGRAGVPIVARKRHIFIIRLEYFTGGFVSAPGVVD